MQRHKPGPTYSLGPALLRYGNRAAQAFPGFDEARRQMLSMVTWLIIAPIFDRQGQVVMTLTLVNDDPPAAVGAVIARATRLRWPAAEVARAIENTR